MRAIRFLALVLATTLLAACGKADAPKRGATPPTLVTVATSSTEDVEVLERTVGHIESLIDPKLGAEVAGRVVQVLAHAGNAVKAGETMAMIDSQDLKLSRDAAVAEINRLSALISNQERIVERNRQLVQSNFVSRNAVDDAIAQLEALREQLAAARAQLALVERNVGKARVTAPMDARVETQIVAVGDYVKVGDPLFFIVSEKRVRAHLPFPEHVASRLKIGLPVRLSVPTAPGPDIEGRIEDIKPMVGAANRALDVIVRLDNPGGWRAGGSVNGAVVVDRRPGAVTVPEQSVVLRPAGRVVYVIKDGKAQQRVVATGARSGGKVEIVSGLAAGETVAVDGAGFLTDGAQVSVKGAGPPAQETKAETAAPR